MPIDHAAWLRTLAESNRHLATLHLSYKFDTHEREKVLRLAHQKGEVINDPVTGERGEILAGVRKRITKVPSAGD